jgi:alpha-galactosidase
MGWRSWNLFGANVDQTLMEKQMDGLVSRSRLVDGVPTSLADLGYNDIGLDDNWQECGTYGPQGYTYHDAKGVPQVNRARFPNFNQMTSYGHSLGLTVGWYGNNCICQDHCTDVACYRGDVFATIQYGFDSIKLDNCGKETDLSMYALLFNSTGKSIMIENCHWGLTLPTATECPYNYYRTSTDIRANYSAVIRNLMTTVPLAKKGLSRPGCWAYPDMVCIVLCISCHLFHFLSLFQMFSSWRLVVLPVRVDLLMLVSPSPSHALTLARGALFHLR